MLENCSLWPSIEARYSIPASNLEESMSVSSKQKDLRVSIPDIQSRTSLIYVKDPVYKFNNDKKWGSLGKMEVVVYTFSEKYWIDICNPDTKRSVFSSIINAGVIAKMEGTLLRLIFPQKPDSAIFGIKLTSLEAAENLFQIAKRGIRTNSQLILKDHSNVMALDSRKIQWSHLKYREIRNSLFKYLDTCAPEYKEISEHIVKWNKNITKPIISSISLGTFSSAFCSNDAVFLGPVHIVLYNYGFAGATDEPSHILASKIVMRSANNPEIVFLSYGVEKMDCIKVSGLPNILKIKFGSLSDYSLSCRDLNHRQSLFEFLVLSIENAQSFKEKCDQIIQEHSDISAKINLWKSKAKEMEKIQKPLLEITSTDCIPIESCAQDINISKQNSVGTENVKENVIINEDKTNAFEIIVESLNKKTISVKTNPEISKNDLESEGLSKGISDITLQEEPLSIESRRQNLVASLQKTSSKSSIKLEQYHQKLLENTDLLISAREETTRLKDEFVQLLMENSKIKQKLYEKTTC